MTPERSRGHSTVLDSNRPNPATGKRKRSSARRWPGPAVHRIAAAVVACLVFTAAAATAYPEDLPKNSGGAADSSEWRLEFGPGGQLYPIYIANPIRPQMGIARAWFSDSDIPNAGDERYIIRLGANVGFLRYAPWLVYPWFPEDPAPAGRPDSGFQLNVEAGYLGMFDLESSQDNIGWDGLYGVLLAWSNGEGLAAQTGIKHVSSHVGDEYAENTGRTRINYTRGEYVLGLSLAGEKFWRVYGEGGYAYDQRNEQLQEDWRLEAGLELTDPHRFWNNRFGWYAAADFNWYQESDWSTDITVQTGLLVAREKLFRTFRLGLEYRKGRSLMGEFFFRDETYISLGLWCDL